MFRLFSLIESEFDALKSKLSGATTEVHAAVSEAVTWTEDELKAAEAGFVATLTDLENTNIGSIFKAGAEWAASRVAVAVATPPVASGNESGVTSSPVAADTSTTSSPGSDGSAASTST
jgi:hypothetical protein